GRAGRAQSSASRPLHSSLDHDEATLGPGDGTGDEQQALLRVHRVDGEVLDGLARVAHPAGHPLATEHAARGGGATDGARLAVVAVRTVGGGDTGEAVPLHHTGSALALGGADHVDRGSGLEGLRGELLAEGVLGGVGRADLCYVPTRGDPGLLEV